MSSAVAQSLELVSPNGVLSLQVFAKDWTSRYRVEPGALWYRVLRGGKTIVADSRLGLELEGGPSFICNLEVVSCVQSSVDTSWTPVYGERSTVADRRATGTLTVRETIPPFRTLLLDLSVFDDAVAFRYRLPEDAAPCRIGNELTQFRFAAGAIGIQQTFPEDEYRPLPLAKLFHKTELPLVVELAGGEGYACINEAGADRHPRMFLAPAGSVEGQDPEECGVLARLGSPCEAGPGFATPWRVVHVVEKPAQLIGIADTLQNLAPPCAIPDTSWIRPGKTIREVMLTTPGGKACIDYAVKRGLQYILYDAGWYGHEYDESSDARTITPDPDRIKNQPAYPGLDLQEVIRYGKERGVGVFLYVNRRALERQLADIVPLFAGWGVAGIKFGFVNYGTEGWTKWLFDAIALCAKHKLHVDVHDFYRPTGLCRTWPNLLTQEGTRGNEHFPTPRHNVTLPFCRFSGGPADYTICYRHAKNQTTSAHQIAMAAVYYSPLQLIYWYMKPENYVGRDAELEFFDRVSTVWDDTVGIDGKIGEFAAVARRKGAEWFVGAMTNEDARTVRIPLSFLEKGKTYQATVFRDGLKADGDLFTSIVREEIRVDAATELDEKLLATGGVAVWIRPGA